MDPNPSIQNLNTGWGTQNNNTSSGQQYIAKNQYIHLPPHRPETPPSPSCVVPFRRDPDFVDRGTLLDQIHKKCSAPASRVALVGLGGVGKSQLAIEHCYRVGEAPLETWVFWVHAGTRARFEEGYRRIAEATKMSGRDDPKADVLRLVRSWLCDKRNGRWLMVVDNADDASVFFQDVLQSRTADGSDAPSAELLSDFLPQSSNGSILFTSRSQDVAYKLTGDFVGIIEVKPMNRDDALALLYKKLGSIPPEDEATELIHALDFMPLALTQAAAFIRQRAPRMSLSRYIDKVRRSDCDRARLLQKDVGDSRRDGRASNSIIATWQISFEHIRKQTPTAARLLSLISLFDQQGIPKSLLKDRYAGKEDGDADFDDDIHILTSFSLIEVSADGREFEMHQLVQFSTKKWLELSNELEPWKVIYVTLMDESYPAGWYENWPACQALFPHAEAMLNSQPKDKTALKAWASVLYKAAWYASEVGLYNKAYEMGSTALQIREKILGPEHIDTLNSLNNFGLLLYRQGQYSEAHGIHQRALEVRKRLFRDSHPDTLTTMVSLAATYSSQGQWKAAEKLQVEAMETSQKKLGTYHPNTLNSLSSLALIYMKQGRWKEAEDLNVQVMETRKTKLGDSHLDTLTSMANLAVTYWSQGRWKKAEALNMQVMETLKTKLGAEHLDTVGSMANLALTYWSQGRWKEAEELHVQVTDTRKAKLGADHHLTLSSMANLASTYRKQGRLAEAEALDVQVMETSKTKLGADHPDTLTFMANLASTYKEQGRWEEAEELHAQVMDARKAKLGADHHATLSSMDNLASTYWSQGRWKEAEELQVQVVDTRKMKLGVDHPSTLISMANLASTYRKQGRWTDAEVLFIQVIETRKKKLGADHPDTLISVANLALTYKNQSRWEEAEELFLQVLEISKTKLGSSHPSTLTSMNHLALMRKDQDRNAEAIELMEECVHLRRHILGANHPIYISSSRTLADWKAEQAKTRSPSIENQ